jgi:hypothetical protein
MIVWSGRPQRAKLIVSSSSSEVGSITSRGQWNKILQGADNSRCSPTLSHVNS